MASREWEGVHELAADALDALDDDDRHAFEEHLDGCEECREEFASLRETAAALAFAAEGPVPPPELRRRILAAAAEERSKVVPLHHARRRWAVPSAAVLAVAACLA